MDDKWIVLGIVVGPLTALLAIATLVKYIEVRRARHWPAAPGRIIAAHSTTRAVRRPSSGNKDTDADIELRNFADIRYEFEVDGKKYPGTRVSIAEDLGNGDVAGTLKRYPANKEIIVYYNPADPRETVIERDMPANSFQAMGWLITILVAGSILAVTGIAGIGRLVGGQIPNPKNMPFVVGFLLMALAAAAFAFAIMRQVRVSRSWSKTKGRIILSRTERFAVSAAKRKASSTKDSSPPETHRRINYAYRVGDIEYGSDRINFGLGNSGTIEFYGTATAARYSQGSPVTVYFDPANPAQAVLEREPRGLWLLWTLIAGFLAVALWFATTVGGKV